MKKILTIIGISIFFVVVAVGAIISTYNSGFNNLEDAQKYISTCPISPTDKPHEDAVWNLDNCYWFVDDSSIPYEIVLLEKMSCDEIIAYNYDPTTNLTKEERKFVRDTIQECRDEMMQSEEFAMYSELDCDEWISMDGKLHVINSNQVRDWVALEILDCKGRNLDK